MSIFFFSNQKVQLAISTYFTLVLAVSSHSSGPNNNISAAFWIFLSGY